MIFPLQNEFHLSNISREHIGSLPELIEKEKQIQKFWAEYVSDESRIINKISNEITTEFLNKYSDDDYDQETINNFFKSKLSALIFEKGGIEISDSSYKPIYKTERKDTNNYNLAKLKKLGTPSVRDWVELIPDLRKINGLNSWRDICEHLRIPVEGDSARRRLKRWVEHNKPNWAIIPEPKK